MGKMLHRWAGAIIMLGLAVSPGAKADPNALWKIIDNRCVPHQRAGANPAPCALVDEKQGYAILKDLTGPSQYLLIPTARITGIEDPKILGPGATNYFAEAWENRHFTEERLRLALPRPDISLAVNSAYGRSQNQLHIHIDCVRTDVAETLHTHEEVIGDTWHEIDLPPKSHPYLAMRISGDTLEGVKPFALVAARGQAGHAMGRQTIVVVGTRFKDGTAGFYLLNGEASLAGLDSGSGEELQDHTCAIARRQ